jgi:hypothetical protein
MLPVGCDRAGFGLMSWLSVREFAELHIDRLIGAERNPEARALLTYHRDQIVNCFELAMHTGLGASPHARQLRQ